MSTRIVVATVCSLYRVRSIINRDFLCTLVWFGLQNCVKISSYFNELQKHDNCLLTFASLIISHNISNNIVHIQVIVTPKQLFCINQSINLSTMASQENKFEEVRIPDVVL